MGPNGTRTKWSDAKVAEEALARLTQETEKSEPEETATTDHS